MKHEKRMAIRRNFRQRALILRLDNSVVDDCAVTDVSATGAQLRLTAQDDLPDEFHLVLAKGGKVHRRCAVVWRSKNRIGVRFVTPEKQEA
jgi:hypothetical protein